jgi:hypothetical protein
MMHHEMPLQHLLSNHLQRTSMGGVSQGFVLQEYHGGMRGAREHGSDSKRKHQVEGATMQAKEWTRPSGRCNPMELAVTKQQIKHEFTR